MKISSLVALYISLQKKNILLTESHIKNIEKFTDEEVNYLKESNNLEVLNVLIDLIQNCDRNHVDLKALFNVILSASTNEILKNACMVAKDKNVQNSGNLLSIVSSVIDTKNDLSLNAKVLATNKRLINNKNILDLIYYVGNANTIRHSNCALLACNIKELVQSKFLVDIVKMISESKLVFSSEVILSLVNYNNNYNSTEKIEALQLLSRCENNKKAVKIYECFNKYKNDNDNDLLLKVAEINNMKIYEEDCHYGEDTYVKFLEYYSKNPDNAINGLENLSLLSDEEFSIKETSIKL